MADSDRFGFAVAISGNTAVVGAYHDAFLNGTPGVAYVFVRTGKTWVEQTQLRTDDSASSPRAGYSVGQLLSAATQ